MFNEKKKAYLMLENGRVYEGVSFGAQGTAFGEIVFTTSMVGYLETITNSNYFGKLVTWTFPNAGNYGINIEDAESTDITAAALIVRECCEKPSNFRSEVTLDEFMMKNNLIGIERIDTRSLTRMLRDNGTMKGVVTTENVNEDIEGWKKKIKEYEIKSSVKDMTVKEPVNINSKDPKFKVAVVDFGLKRTVKDALLEKGCSLTLFPSSSTVEEIKAIVPDGIVLSNGTANPEECGDQIELIKELCAMNVPIFGIELGHQLLAVANGARSQKLKYGHRGSNQPVIDLKTGQTVVTEQGHGYIVTDLPEETAEVTYINDNDKSCEGIEYKKIPAFSVQFSPKQENYNKFIEMMSR